MKYKVICILLILPIILTLIVFTATSNVSLPVESQVDRIVLEHDVIEPVKVGDDDYKIYAYSIPQTELVYEVSDSSIATITKRGSDYYLDPLKEGVVTVYVSTLDRSVLSSFDAYVYVDRGLGAQDILVVDKTQERNELVDTYYYGEYNLVNHGLVKSTIDLNINVLGTNNQSVRIDVTSGHATIKNSSITVVEPDANSNITLKITSLENESVSTTYTLPIVKGGVNVYSYEDLMDCTNRGGGHKVVLRTNFESRLNALSDPTNLSSSTYRNSTLFGTIGRNTLEFETLKIESSYDTTYIDNYNNSANVTDTISKDLVVGLKFENDVYGNGYTINLHELCYPKGSPVNDIPQLSNSNLFRGPLPFVQAIGMATVFGQDNIGTLIDGDGITVRDLNLKNCNNISNLSNLNYVGTTLEVMGDDVSIVNSVISNGRTVVRSFSNENLTIDHCLLQYAREFILKVGSNTTLKPEAGQDITKLTGTELINFLAPDLPQDADGKYASDSSVKVNDTFFYSSGLFSIGLDTHFAGELLYDSVQTSPGAYFPEVRNLAGTSYATYMDITGDTRFYDWKNVKDLDASTLITALNGDTSLINRFFDIQQIVENYITQVDQSFAISETDDGVVKNYVHGGIAYYGGGKNFSQVTVDSEIADDLKVIPSLTIGGTISIASGRSPFKFMLYTNETSPSYFKEYPTISDLKAVGGN